jgi:hypothetical protein
LDYITNIFIIKIQNRKNIMNKMKNHLEFHHPE